MTETLQEFCDWRGLSMRVDRTAGVIHGVKILGLASRNGRSYLPEALAAATPLYENAKVNVNHARGQAAAPRDYQDRIGVIRNVAARPDGLFADFHYNPKHALAEQLLWDAEHSPESVGFSHNVEARTARQGERVVVEAIVRVQCVDLVADPATTQGLFETHGEGDRPICSGTATNASHPCPTAPEKAGTVPTKALTEEHAAELRRHQAEVDRLKALEAGAQRQQLVRQLLHEHKLPEPEAAEPAAGAILSRRFLESLLAAPDEPTVRALVEERAALVRAVSSGVSAAAFGRPVCRDQHLVDGPAGFDTKAFVAAIT